MEDLMQTDVLSKCVVTLIKRAIKDNADDIYVSMDLTVGVISVDNKGKGINKRCLPQHYGSDWDFDLESNSMNSRDSMNKLIINDLLSVSKTVTIESHFSFGSSFKVIYYKGRIKRITLIEYCENQGTHISVQLKNNCLFSGTVGDLEKVRSQLTRKVASLLLMNPEIKIVLSDKQFGYLLNTFSYNTCMSSVFFDLIDHHGSEISVNASYENINMNVHFVSDFHNSDEYQFIFFNKIFIDLKVLYKTLNDFFDVAFSKRNIEIKDQEHFMYLLEIECSDFEIIDLIQGLKNNDESNLVNKMIMCLISLEQNMLENYDCFNQTKELKENLMRPINYTYDCSDYNTKLEMDRIMEKSNFSELQTSEINFSNNFFKYFSNKSLYTQEKEIDNLITKWLIYDVGSFLLKLIKPCTLINQYVNLNVLLKNVNNFFDLKVISKNNKQLHYVFINKEIWTHFIREVKCFDIDMSSKFLKFCFKVLLKLFRESMSYEIGHNIDTCTQISVLFPKLIEMVYNTKFLPPFSMICDDTCNNATSRIIITNAAINYTDNSVIKMKSSTNIKGNFDLIDNLENDNSMSNKTLPTYKLCDSINNFIISGRNPFVPKGSSPIMLVKDKLFIASLNSDINKSQLENVVNRKLKRSVEFIIENERELKFSPNQKLWTIDKKFFNQLEVIGQLDKKYILCMVNTQVKTEKYLIALDQHAIDERIQLEKLLSSFSDPIFEGCLKTHFLTEHWLIISPIKKDLQTILKYTKDFRKIGLQFTEIPNGTIAVISIPECLYWIASKKAASTTEYYNFLSDSVKTIINEQLCSIYESGTIRHIIPSVLYKHLCREACLKAVNFGNILSISDCQQLISKISFCSLPFMCAHGRPLISFLRKIVINPRIVDYPALKKLKK